jgi:hypothetical protein
MSKYPQAATYWTPSTLNEYGEKTFANPTTLTVRWEEKTEQFIDRETGKEQRSHSVVYTNVDVVEDGFLFLGTSVSTTPKEVDKAFPIRRVDKSPSLKGNKYVRKVWL